MLGWCHTQRAQFVNVLETHPNQIRELIQNTYQYRVTAASFHENDKLGQYFLGRHCENGVTNAICSMTQNGSTEGR